jgi:2,4-dienoyl-CoA reductase-like NADH-dependent reductase (Old Yellow Enzyme family)
VTDSDLPADPHAALLRPLRFRNLTIKNRVVRGNVAGRFDHYDGSGTQARINWEVRFARGGAGALLSSWCGVDLRGRIVPGYATIDRDDRIPFWRELGERVHEHDCKFILQLAHAGRQRDIPGFEIPTAVSSTDRPDPLHGFETERASKAELQRIAGAFAAGARRAREAGLDGVEVHAANGYLFTQFLSPAINDRRDGYGGSLENRARLLLEVVRAIRTEVGDDYHLQVKLSARDRGNALMPWARRGTSLDDSVQVSRWLEEAGVDAIQVSTGNAFPHPDNPAGEFSAADVVQSYDVLLSSGRYTFRNYLLFRTWPFSRLFEWRAGRSLEQLEGANLPDARAIKRVVSIPVLCTGGFQRASHAAAAIERGDCDAVAVVRALIANPDLARLYEQGHDVPPNPCTYSNKCLYNVLENPLGCYDERRYGSREEMVREILSVYEPAGSEGGAR